ncbi:MAG: 50S ribosomal protein L25 [Ardenticatenales bacterium]|nr:50S ribosomal protein L25 [Ardenticatenales bacterium]
MEHIKLNAENREVTGKKVSRLRKEGIVPAVVYGGPLTSAISLQINGKELDKALRQAGTGRVIDLAVQGKSYPVLARMVQRHVTRHQITHIDFLAVRMDQPIEAQIPISIIGESALVENHEAVMMHPLDSLTVRALPDELPAHVEIDISALTEIGQSITVADLKLPRGVMVMNDSDILLVSLVAPSREVEAEDEAVAEAGEAGEISEGEGETADEGEE